MAGASWVCAKWLEQLREAILDDGVDYLAPIADRFGQIAQVFSTYEYRFAEDEPGHLKGINSFQLLHKDGRWWIVTVFWDNESEGNRIPAEYL